jgi:hypothetical protein
MRDGDQDYFGRESRKAQGYINIPFDASSMSELHYSTLNELVWDIFYAANEDFNGHPSDIELDYELNIFYREMESADELEEEDIPREEVAFSADVDVVLEEEAALMPDEMDAWLEVCNGRPMSERKTEQEQRDGCILFHHVFRTIHPKKEAPEGA